MVQYSPEELFAWVRDVKPAYLTTTPSMALRLATIALGRNGERIPIRQIITFSETVTDECRNLCRTAFGARITDRYSCEELGWIALQCPKHDHYHILASNVIAEVVDDANRPCEPGVPGRVLVTSLHSYAMPMLRYDIGDYAELGEACDCGINLPVMKRIHGRQRSFITLPDGSSRLARLTGEHWREIAPVSEYRLVQYRDGLVEAFVVCERAVSAAETASMEAMIRRVLGPVADIKITHTHVIDWGHRTKRIDVMQLDRLRDGAGQ
jgi:phenylacetate-CoA ligase